MEFCGMEARALKKSSFTRELSMKQTQQDFLEDDDFQGYNPANGVVSVEDFSVDCFLDFDEFKENYLHEKVTTEEEEEENDDDEEEEEEEKDSLSVSSQERTDDDSNSNSTCFSDSFLPTELSLPVDDLAELEWVSKFVDDSLSDLPQFYPSIVNEEKPQIPSRNLVEPQQPKPALTKTVLLLPSVFPFQVPAKPRTKRTRPSTGPTWSVRSSIMEPSSSSSTTSSNSSPPHLIFTNTVQPLHGLGEPATKKPKKRSTVQTAVGLIQFQRRCSHCQVHKTPQWRTGPLGPKTLCNACGVRFKSGRLFPEYRPACSPTFSSDIHSNSHRKVLEMRKKRELVGSIGFETKPNDLKVLNG